MTITANANWPTCRTCGDTWDPLCQDYRDDCDPSNWQEQRLAEIRERVTYYATTGADVAGIDPVRYVIDAKDLLAEIDRLKEELDDTMEMVQFAATMNILDATR